MRSDYHLASRRWRARHDIKDCPDTQAPHLHLEAVIWSTLACGNIATIVLQQFAHLRECTRFGMRSGPDKHERRRKLNQLEGVPTSETARVRFCRHL